MALQIVSLTYLKVTTRNHNISHTCLFASQCDWTYGNTYLFLVMVKIWKYNCRFYHFVKSRWCRQWKPLHLVDKIFPVLDMQNHCCWWLTDESSQDGNSHGIDLVVPKSFGLGFRGVIDYAQSLFSWSGIIVWGNKRRFQLWEYLGHFPFVPLATTLMSMLKVDLLVDTRWYQLKNQISTMLLSGWSEQQSLLSVSIPPLAIIDGSNC